MPPSCLQPAIPPALTLTGICTGVALYTYSQKKTLQMYKLEKEFGSNGDQIHGVCILFFDSKGRVVSSFGTWSILHGITWPILSQICSVELGATSVVPSEQMDASAPFFL